MIFGINVLRASEHVNVTIHANLEQDHMRVNFMGSGTYAQSAFPGRGGGVRVVPIAGSESEGERRERDSED